MFDKKAWRKEWNKNNKDKIRGYEEKRRNSPEGKASKKKRGKKYRDKPENKEAMRLYGIAYRQKNKEKIKLRKRLYKQQNREKVNEHNRLFRMKNPELQKERDRRGHLRRKFGITLDEYNALLKKQNGVCAICYRPEIGKELSVDHCHKTGRVRGLLCAQCNQAIGMFGESVKVLTNAIEYIEKERGKDALRIPYIRLA